MVQHLLSADPSKMLEMLTRYDLSTYTAFTFFVGTMAMMAASAFFFLEMRNVPEKWRTSLLVSGLITFIAAVHYYYMREFYTATETSPTFFRYVDSFQPVAFNHAPCNEDGPQSVTTCAVKPYCVPDAIIVDVDLNVEYVDELLHDSLHKDAPRDVLRGAG